MESRLAGADKRASEQASRPTRYTGLATPRCAARADPATPLAYYVTPGNVAGIHREGISAGRAATDEPEEGSPAGREGCTGGEGIIYDRDARTCAYIHSPRVRARIAIYMRRVHRAYTCACVYTRHGIPTLCARSASRCNPLVRITFGYIYI